MFLAVNPFGGMSVANWSMIEPVNISQYSIMTSGDTMTKGITHQVTPWEAIPMDSSQPHVVPSP